LEVQESGVREATWEVFHSKPDMHEFIKQVLIVLTEVQKPLIGVRNR